MTAATHIKKLKAKKRPPTNTELLLAIEAMRNEDRKEVNRRLRGQDHKILGLASNASVQAVQTTVEVMSKAMFDENSDLKLATKLDVQPVVIWHQNLVQAAKLTSIGGKWGARTILTIAGILAAIAVITGGIKGLIAAAVAWATGGMH